MADKEPELRETRLEAAHRRYGYLVVSLAIVIVLLLGSLDPDRGPVSGPTGLTAAFDLAHDRLHFTFYIVCIGLAALGMAIFRPVHRALLMRYAAWILSAGDLAGYRYRRLSGIALAISLAAIMAILAAGVWVKQTWGWSSPWAD